MAQSTVQDMVLLLLRLQDPSVSALSPLALSQFLFSHLLLSWRIALGRHLFFSHILLALPLHDMVIVSCAPFLFCLSLTMVDELIVRLAVLISMCDPSYATLASNRSDPQHVRAVL